MRTIEHSSAFKRDYRKLKQTSRYRNLDDRLIVVLNRLAADLPLAPANRDHALSGNWANYRECHLWPDLLLIYSKPSEEGSSARAARLP